MALATRPASPPRQDDDRCGCWSASGTCITPFAIKGARQRSGVRPLTRGHPSIRDIFEDANADPSHGATSGDRPNPPQQVMSLVPRIQPVYRELAAALSDPP